MNKMRENNQLNIHTDKIFVKDVIDKLSLNDNEKYELLEKVANKIRERIEKEFYMPLFLNGGNKWQNILPKKQNDYRIINTTCA